MSMRDKKVPNIMYTGPINVTPFSSHVTTITDLSAEPEREVATDNYGVLQPFSSPKGVTNEIITFEGEDVVNKFIKLFGRPNTVRYGRSMTWAYRALQSGFRVSVCNLRTPDCTYPNFFISLGFEKQMVDSQAKKKVGVAVLIKDIKLDKSLHGYHFFMAESKEGINDFLKKYFPKDTTFAEIKVFGNGGEILKVENKKELEAGDTVDVTAGFDTYSFGFFVKHIQNLHEDQDFSAFLTTKEGTKDAPAEFDTAMVEGVVKPFDPTQAGAGAKDSSFCYPIFGAAYRGAGDYGNRYFCQFGVDSNNKLDRKYPVYRVEFKSGPRKTEYGFDFVPFKYSMGATSYAWDNRVYRQCEVTHSLTNKTKEFVGFLQPRRTANEMEAAVKGIYEAFKEDRLTVAKLFDANCSEDKPDPEFNIPEDAGSGFTQKFAERANALSAARWAAFYDTFDTLTENFKRSEDPIARTAETPLSLVDIMAFGKQEMVTVTGKRYTVAKECPGFEFQYIPPVVEFKGGSLGCLEPIFRDEEFDFYREVKIPDVKWEKNEDTGAWTEIKVPEDELPSTPVWIDLYSKFYRGEIDRSIFDQTIVKDCILFGDDYPNEVQEVIADLVKYHEAVIHKEKTRVDFSYIRTPEASVRSISDVISWAQTWQEKSKNINVHPCVGSWLFNDESTHGQERFSGWFEYLGYNGSLFQYLVKGTSDSFASGDYSVVFSGEPGTGLCIPYSTEEKTALVKYDIMYFFRRSDGYYALAEDSAFYPGYNSGIKNVGSNWHHNRMINALDCYLQDRRVNNTDKNTLERIKKDAERVIEQGARHFDGRVTIDVQVSDDPNEVGKHVILVNVRTQPHRYSKRTRTNYIILPLTV